MGEALELPETGSCGSEVLQPEPIRLVLGVRRSTSALGAMGDFADLVSPYFVGHSAGVAELAGEAAGSMGMEPVICRGSTGRPWSMTWVGWRSSTSMWNKPGPLTAVSGNRFDSTRTTPNGC